MTLSHSVQMQDEYLERNTVNYYFCDSMKQMPGNKYVCFHISQFLLALTKQGNGAQRDFSPRFSSDFENKQKVLIKGILAMHLFPLEIKD